MINFMNVNSSFIISVVFYTLPFILTTYSDNTTYIFISGSSAQNIMFLINIFSNKINKINIIDIDLVVIVVKLY